MDTITLAQRRNMEKILSEELEHAKKRRDAFQFGGRVFTITDIPQKTWVNRMLNDIGNQISALEYILENLSTLDVKPQEQPKEIKPVILPPTEGDKMLFDVYKNYVLSNLSKQDQQRHFSNAMEHFMRTDPEWFNFTSTLRAVSQHGDVYDDSKWCTARDTISKSSVFQSFAKRFI